MSSRSSRTIYVGNLPGDTRMREVEDLFYKYGRIVDIDLKLPPRPPGYAFIEYEDPHDAEDAIYYRDGYDFDGCRLRVELAHSGRSYSSSVDRYGSHSGSSSSRGLPRHSDYRVLVTGLPPSASWQDLKDHMRQAGDVLFSQVYRDRGGMKGIVDYAHYDDMKYAVREYDSRRSYSRSRSCDSRRSYSHSSYISRSPSRSRSYGGRSRSISPEREYSHQSPSESRSRSPPKSRSLVTSANHKRRSRSRSRSRSRRSLSQSRSPAARSERSKSVDSKDRY